jgi:hypothetical protein
MYYATSGSSRITFADGSVTVTNARFTIGMVGGDAAADTTATTTPGGELDLSEGTVLTVVVSDAVDVVPEDTEDAGGNNFIVYVDNNTTSSGNCMWGSDGKVIELELADIATDLETTNPLTLTAAVPTGVGTTASFLQVRTESGGSITIDSIAIE